VLDALEFERDRETAVRSQIEDVLTELEGSRIDAAVFARMAPEDVSLVRGVIEPDSDEDEYDEDDTQGLLSPESRAEIRAEQEAERVRLEGVMADSLNRQRALESYIEALDACGKASGAGRA
jgi:hypothetical protein